MHDGVIVIGCHRSGTSLVAAMLRQAGVHLGHDCGALAESRFFRAVNVRLLRRAGAAWYRPDPMARALDDPRRRRGLEATLRRALDSPGRFDYLGSTGYTRVESQDRPWGWKDPRTTLTLPLWVKRFPHARVLHVVRNGIGVARSLVARQRSLRRGPAAVVTHLIRRAWPGRWPDAERTWQAFRDRGRPSSSGRATSESAWRPASPCPPSGCWCSGTRICLPSPSAGVGRSLPSPARSGTPS